MKHLATAFAAAAALAPLSAFAHGTAFGYACQEDETVDPVTWPCVAN
ncbi:hypothetical protein BH10BDE1_BH10BDE1_02590 [soil metagenome]